MSLNACLDLDVILQTWVTKKMGDDFSVDKYDFSKAEVTQTSVVYNGASDWFRTENMMEDIYDNQEKLTSSWHHKQALNFKSHAKWSLSRWVRSKNTLSVKCSLEFPMAEPGMQPMSVVFDSTADEPTSKSNERDTQLDAEAYVTVQPHCTSRTTTQLRICKLHNVPFVADIQFSGQIRVCGHKKRKSWGKQDLTSNLTEALEDVDGFKIVENVSGDRGQPAKVATFRVEGFCTGEQAYEAVTQVKEMQSVV